MRRIRVKTARLAHRVSQIRVIDNLLNAQYLRAKTRHAPLLPVLSGLDREIVEGLERDGVFVTTLDALGLPGSREIVETGLSLAEDFAEEANARAAAGTQFLMVPPAATVAEPDLFTWGLQDRLLDIVESYIGLPAAYDGMTVLYTVADGKEQATRKWHRDREDRRMLKIAVYCHDVDEDGGPFELDTRCEHAQGRPEAPHIATCIGKAGTVIFADTARCLHRGRPAGRRDRSAIFFSYISHRPRNPFFCERSGLTRRQVAGLVAGLPKRQVRSALWHDALPPLVRLIPSQPL